MEKISLGVVGLGHRGRELFKLAAKFDCVIPAAVCDLRSENWYEKQWLSDAPMSELFPDVIFYTDYEKMLDEVKPDIAFILVENCQKPEVVEACAKRGVDVCIEKPIAISYEEACKIEENVKNTVFMQW